MKITGLPRKCMVVAIINRLIDQGYIEREKTLYRQDRNIAGINIYTCKKKGADYLLAILEKGWKNSPIPFHLEPLFDIRFSIRTGNLGIKKIWKEEADKMKKKAATFYARRNHKLKISKEIKDCQEEKLAPLAAPSGVISSKKASNSPMKTKEEAFVGRKLTKLEKKKLDILPHALKAIANKANFSMCLNLPLPILRKAIKKYEHKLKKGYNMHHKWKFFAWITTQFKKRAENGKQKLPEWNTKLAQDIEKAVNGETNETIKKLMGSDYWSAVIQSLREFLKKGILQVKNLFAFIKKMLIYAKER